MGRGIVNSAYLFALMGGGADKAQKDYTGLLEIQREKFGFEAFEEAMEKAFAKGYYESDRKVVRDVPPDKVISVLAKILEISSTDIVQMRYDRRSKRFKGILAISLRIYSNMSLTEMTKIFKGRTSSAIGVYAKYGFELPEQGDPAFKKLEIAL